MITYFSQFETEELQKTMSKGMTIATDKMEEISEGKINPVEAISGQGFSIENMMNANRLARKTAIKKLIDMDGTEYESTEENVNNFFDQADGTALQIAIDEMSKKK